MIYFILVFGCGLVAGMCVTLAIVLSRYVGVIQIHQGLYRAALYESKRLIEIAKTSDHDVEVLVNLFHAHFTIGQCFALKLLQIPPAEVEQLQAVRAEVLHLFAERMKRLV